MTNLLFFFFNHNKKGIEVKWFLAIDFFKKFYLDSLELLIFLFPSPKCLNYRCAPPHPASLLRLSFPGNGPENESPPLSKNITHCQPLTPDMASPPNEIQSAPTEGKKP